MQCVSVCNRIAEPVERRGGLPLGGGLRTDDGELLHDGEQLVVPVEIRREKQQREHRRHERFAPHARCDEREQPAEQRRARAGEAGQRERDDDKRQNAQRRQRRDQQPHHERRNHHEQPENQVIHQQRSHARREDEPRRDGHRKQQLVVLCLEELRLCHECGEDEHHRKRGKTHQREVEPSNTRSGERPGQLAEIHAEQKCKAAERIHHQNRKADRAAPGLLL